MRVLVLGGRGFIGAHAVAALRAAGHEVRVGSRRQGAGLSTCHLERLRTVPDVLPLLAGADAVLNCVGILRERPGGETYEALHRRAPALLAQACRERGIRYLHVSALGLRHPHRSGFLTSKLAGERAIVAAGGDFRIVRPSLLDGRGGFGARYLRALAALPLHFHARAARGRIAALDVAELGEALATLCVRKIAATASVGERCFELGGTEAWPLADYLGAMRGRAPWARLRVPDWLCRAVAHACDFVHFSPFSFGHWELLQHDNLPQPNRLPELLGRAPRTVGREPAAPRPAATAWIRRAASGLVLIALALALAPGRALAGEVSVAVPAIPEPTAVPAPTAVALDRRIAITFDDLPWVMLRNEPPADLAARHARLVAALKEATVPAIGFVNEGLLYEGDTLRPERVQLLDDWLDAGLELGNHTRWHSDLNAVGAGEFEQDILDGERLLRPLLARRGSEPQWFRYPLLRMGATLEDKAEVEGFLAGHGYRIAPATVNSSEWVFALAYRRAMAADASEETLQRLRDDYVAYMLAKLEFYERRSIELLGYELPQVLLLHANELNADASAALLSAIRARGYRFVTLAEAASDAAYGRPDTYVGPLGTSWIHRWARTEGRPETFFFGEPKTPAWISELAGAPPSFE